MQMNVGIVGSGGIGSAIGRFLKAGAIPGLTLTGLAGADDGQLRRVARELDVPAYAWEALLASCDLVLEATAAQAMPALVRQAVLAGKKVLALSVGGFAFDPDLLAFLEAHPADIFLPSGGIIGLDGLLALREIGLDRVEVTTTKAPRSLKGAPFFSGAGSHVDLDAIQSPTQIFSGTAREAIAAFPANTNLAITLSLAGIGFDRTRVNIIADPSAGKTRQCLHAEAGGCILDTAIEGIPLPENPRTALVAANSAKALLRKIASGVHIGT